MDGGAEKVEHDQQLVAAEKELDELAEAFKSGTMRSFGEQEHQVLDQIEKLRSDQTQLFVDYMQVELKAKYRNVDVDLFDKDYENVREQNFEDVTAAFNEKEQNVENLTNKLTKLVEDMNAISEALKEPDSL